MLDASSGRHYLLDLSYNYNRNNSVGTGTGKTGHLTKITDNINSAKNREYEFDALGRLTKAKGGPTGNLSSQTYTYDRYGNRTSVTAAGVAADNSTMPSDGIPSLAYDNTNNRITTSGFEYDVAGNQTKGFTEDGTAVKFEYDAANRLHIIKRASDDAYLQAFQFGSTNARLMDTDYQTGFTRMFASVGGTVLAEYHENYATPLAWIKSYVYLGDSQLSTILKDGGSGEYTEYNHPDRLGTRLITNQALGSSYEQAHLPFGTALNAETTGSTNKRFTTYDRSAPTGLDYAINRTYDSKLGRFTQVDPIGMQSVSFAAPQTLNMYAYCANDPINYLDPTGLFFGRLFRWLARLLGFLSENRRARLIIVNFVARTVAREMIENNLISLSLRIISVLRAVGAIADSLGQTRYSGNESSSGAGSGTCPLSPTELASCVAKCMNDLRIDKVAKAVGDKTGIPYAGDFLQGLTWVGTGAAAGNQLLNATSLGKYPRSPVGGAKTRGAPTTWQHRTFGQAGLGGALRRAGAPNAARIAGVAGKVTGRVAVPVSAGLIAFEAGYTSGTAYACAVGCILRGKLCNRAK